MHFSRIDATTMTTYPMKFHKWGLGPRPYHCLKEIKRLFSKYHRLRYNIDVTIFLKSSNNISLYSVFWIVTILEWCVFSSLFSGFYLIVLSSLSTRLFFDLEKIPNNLCFCCFLFLWTWSERWAPLKSILAM